MGRKNGIDAAIIVTAVSEADQMSRSAEVSFEKKKKVSGHSSKQEEEKKKVLQVKSALREVPVR